MGSNRGQGGHMEVIIFKVSEATMQFVGMGDTIIDTLFVIFFAGLFTCILSGVTYNP